MFDEIVALYYSKKPFCDEGLEFLLDRNLSPNVAHRAGCCSKDGNMYFLYCKDGLPVRFKVRNMKNKKDQKWSSLTNEDKDSFKTPFFSHSKGSPSDYLIITEGELDCVALSQLGASNCVSLPNGASSVEKTFRENYEYLQQFETIYIAFDMDKPGEEAAKKAMSLLSPKKYRRIAFPNKDANDWLKENPEIDFYDLQSLMASASKVESPDFTNLVDAKKEYHDELDLGLSTGWNKLDQILGGLRKGEVTVVSADTGSGKSTFCINLFKNIAEQGKAVWINSYEMSPTMVYRKLASAVLQKKMKFQAFSSEESKEFKDWSLKHKCYLNVSNRSVNLKDLRNQFEMASLAYDVGYILIDHLDYLVNLKADSRLEAIDETIKEIHSLAMEFGVSVVLVVHPKQLPEGKEVSMHDLKGSSAIKQYADNIMVVTRMDRLEPSDKLRVKIRVWKNRLCGIESFFYLRYVPETDGYTETF